MRAIAALMTLILAGSAASAEYRAVSGAGLLSCGTWTKHRNDLPYAYQFQAWVDGYLSAYNIASDGADFLLPVLKNKDGIYAWIDEYCRANPLDPIIKGMLPLIEQLKTRAQ